MKLANCTASTRPLPVDRISEEGVLQRNVCEHRLQPTKILVIWSEEDVTVPTCGMQLAREAVRHVDPRYETHLLPRPFQHFMNRIMPN